MQSNRAQAAEHARDQRGKGQPQQEAKRKRTETRRVLRAIRGRIRGRTSMRRHRKRGLCVACCVVLEASQPARTAAKAVAQTGWKPQRNRGRQSRFNFTPALFAPQQRGATRKPGFGWQHEPRPRGRRINSRLSRVGSVCPKPPAPAKLEGYASMHPPHTVQSSRRAQAPH